MFETAYTAALAVIPNGPAKTAGISVGGASAAAILAVRANDGWSQQTILDFGYPQGTAPGEYRFTPPATFHFCPLGGACSRSHFFDPINSGQILPIRWTANDTPQTSTR